MYKDKLSKLKKWMCCVAVTAFITHTSQNVFSQQNPLTSKINDRTIVAECTYNYNINGHPAVSYSFRENDNILKDTNFYYVIPPDHKPVELFCHNNISLIISDKGLVVPFYGYNKIALMTNPNLVTKVSTLINIIESMKEDNNHNDKITAAKIDYREENDFLNGIYFITKKGFAIFLSLNREVKNEDIFDYKKNGKMRYSQLLSEKEAMGTKLEVHNGWGIIASPEKTYIRRYENNEKIYSERYDYPPQKKITLVHDKEKPNTIRVIGDNKKELLTVTLEKDYVVASQNGEEDITYLSDLKEQKK